MLSKLRAQSVLSWLLYLVVVLAAVPVQASTPDYLDDASYDIPVNYESIYDPLEPFNRVMFTFNDRLYLWVIDPVATGYSKVVPSDFRTIISNFFYNLGEPVRSVNCLLQGRVADSGLVLSRFLINSTAGVFGLADPAGNEFKMKRIPGSLGQTFATWGIGDGVYLVVPVLGPSTLRDLTGAIGDGVARGLYTPWNDDLSTTSAIYGSQTINEFSLHLGQYQDMKSISLDPYVAFRNGYFQLRQKGPRTGNAAEFPAITPPDINYQK